MKKIDIFSFVKMENPSELKLLCVKHNGWLSRHKIVGNNSIVFYDDFLIDNKNYKRTITITVLASHCLYIRFFKIDLAGFPSFKACFPFCASSSCSFLKKG